MHLKTYLLTVICIWAVSFSPLLAISEKPLQNRDIIALVKVGFTDQTLIKHIETSENVDFDVSVAGLLALKQAGVSDKVISTMVSRSTKSSPVADNKNPRPGPVSTQFAPNFTVHGGRRVLGIGLDDGSLVVSADRIGYSGSHKYTLYLPWPGVKLICKDDGPISSIIEIHGEEADTIRFELSFRSRTEREYDAEWIIQQLRQAQSNGFPGLSAVHISNNCSDD
jgi:hypothetical protein